MNVENEFEKAANEYLRIQLRLNDEDMEYLEYEHDLDHHEFGEPVSDIARYFFKAGLKIGSDQPKSE